MLVKKLKMKSLKIVKSELPLTEYAPSYKYFVFENIITKVDFKKVSDFILKKEKEIVEKFPTNGDGDTGLGDSSLTARFKQFNVFEWVDECQELKIIQRLYEFPIRGSVSAYDENKKQHINLKEFEVPENLFLATSKESITNFLLIFSFPIDPNSPSKKPKSKEALWIIIFLSLIKLKNSSTTLSNVSLSLKNFSEKP